MKIPYKPHRGRGMGTIVRAGTGWRWSRQVKGVTQTGRSHPTRESALAELDRMLADPTFVPPPPRSRAESARIGGAVRSRAHAEAVAAARHIPAAALPQDEPAGPTDAEIAAAERTAPRWGKRLASGKRRCLPCGGTGIDNRPGPGAGIACLNCWTEGCG
jgi:hypothetical protein